MIAPALVAVVASTVLMAEPKPEPQDVVFYNARIALRENRSVDVLRLWLLRNAIAENIGGSNDRVPDAAHDDDFRSLVWAALGNLGYCEDGFPEDQARGGQGGAGLFPLATHNLLLQTMSHGPPPEQPAAFGAFHVARQNRPISLNDVLSQEELKHVSFARTPCLLPTLTFVQHPSLNWPDFKDRLFVGHLLHAMLEEARTSLSHEKVASTALIEARLFDLELNLARLEAIRARQRGGFAAQMAHAVGLPQGAIDEVRRQMSAPPTNTVEYALLERALKWKPREWMDLSRDRRISLYLHARDVVEPADRKKLNPLVMGILDECIKRHQGAEAASWIGLLEYETPDETRAAQSDVVDGDRGLALLALDTNTGFRDRAVVALHRGIHFLEAGERDDALRSFAYAVGHAEEERDGEATHALALRWLTYVLSQYESSAAVVDTLHELVPRADFNHVVEELIWRASLRADVTSFEKLAQTVRRGSSLDARIDDLRPLAQGKPGAMIDRIDAKAKEEPSSVLAFFVVFLNELESESADVRAAQVPTLKLVADSTRKIEAANEGSLARKAQALLQRVDALLEGLGKIGEVPGADVRSLASSRQAFAGAVRLAPSDKPPWPFPEPQADAPSAFMPIILKPEEWRKDDGTLVFGWRLTE